jgi:hypothetical protein
MNSGGFSRAGGFRNNPPGLARPVRAGCLGRAELDLHTLVWTRGAAFPIMSPENRLKCPLCGSRRVSTVFDPPKEPNTSGTALRRAW